jgi:hypothetical protein
MQPLITSSIDAIAALGLASEAFERAAVAQVVLFERGDTAAALAILEAVYSSICGRRGACGAELAVERRHIAKVLNNHGEFAAGYAQLVAASALALRNAAAQNDEAAALLGLGRNEEAAVVAQGALAAAIDGGDAVVAQSAVAALERALGVDRAAAAMQPLVTSSVGVIAALGLASEAFERAAVAAAATAFKRGNVASTMAIRDIIVDSAWRRSASFADIAAAFRGFGSALVSCGEYAAGHAQLLRAAKIAPRTPAAAQYDEAAALLVLGRNEEAAIAARGALAAAIDGGDAVVAQSAVAALERSLGVERAAAAMEPLLIGMNPEAAAAAETLDRQRHAAPGAAGRVEHGDAARSNSGSGIFRALGASARLRGAASPVVIGILTTRELHSRIELLYTAWASVSRVPIPIVTDSAEGLTFIDPLSAVRVWVTPCASTRLLGFACKTRHFFEAAPSRYPAAEWFMRITDDALVVVDGLIEWLASLGNSTPPRTIGQRHTASMSFDPRPDWAQTHVEHPPGAGFMVSRGAATDARWPASFERSMRRWGQDDLAWGGMLAELGWPRMEPSLGFWFWPPSTLPGECYPWYMCLPPPVRGIPVVALPVFFHLHGGGWDVDRQQRLVAALNPGRFSVIAAPPPPLDEYYAVMFARQRQQCVAFGDPQTDCDTIGEFTNYCWCRVPCKEDRICREVS